MQARLNLPEISTFSFRTNTTDTPLNPHYPKIFEKKNRIEIDEIVNHLSIYESTRICTCQKGLWDTKEMYTSCYNLNVWYQLNNLLSQYDYFNVFYGSSLLKTLIAYNLNTCNKKHFYWEIASHCPGFFFKFTVVGTTNSERSRLYSHNKTQLVKRADFLLPIQR